MPICCINKVDVGAQHAAVFKDSITTDCGVLSTSLSPGISAATPHNVLLVSRNLHVFKSQIRGDAAESCLP